MTRRKSGWAQLWPKATALTFVAITFVHGNTAAAQAVTSKGARILGMDTANSAEKAPPLDPYYRARAAGAEATSLSLNWNQIEPAPNTYVDPYGLLATTNWFYPAGGTRLSLTIRPIDGNWKPVPSDLVGVAFDDPRMIHRFIAMLAWVLQRMPDVTFTSIQIGNEIDLYEDLDVTAYAAFLYWSNIQIKTLRPDIRVGFTATWGGLVAGPTSDALLWLKPWVDVVGVTYYPLAANYQARQPTVVQGDFDALIDRVGDRVVFLQEVGYPSGSLNNSSDVKQRDFVRNVFAAWDRYANIIEYLSFVRVQDWSQERANSVASEPPHGVPDPRFAEYLKTLGFRTYPGTGLDKPALTTLAQEAAARGWGGQPD